MRSEADGCARARLRLAPKKSATCRASSVSERGRARSRQLFPGPALVFSAPLLSQLVGRLLGRSPSWTSNQTNPTPPRPALHRTLAMPVVQATRVMCFCLPFAVWSQSQLGSMPGRDPPQETRFRNGSAWEMRLEESRVCVQDRRELCVCGGLVEQYRLYFLSLSKDCVLKSEDRVPRRR